MTLFRQNVVDEVCKIVKKEFYNPNFDFESWFEKHASIRKDAIAAHTPDEFDRAMNRLLKTLKTSHTYYYSKRDPRRYQLFGIFHKVFPDNDPIELCVYPGIGIDTKINPSNDRHVVTSIYEGLPAEKAGLQFGDVLLEVNSSPFHPMLSFDGQAGKQAKLLVQRNGSKVDVHVPVVKIDGRDVFEKTLSASSRTFTVGDQKIGYVHVRSYAGTQYQELLRNLILFGELSRCDGLVLDLRDGWGGADLNYLNLFRDPIAIVSSTPRRGPPGSYSGVWQKPVTLITNGRSTSGKELFAYGFQKLKLGKIVGEKTAGAVVGGRCFLLSNGDALYLAVVDVSVDGVRLEGVGVRPDIEVPRIAETTANHWTRDPQINAAVQQCVSESLMIKREK